MYPTWMNVFQVTPIKGTKIGHIEMMTRWPRVQEKQQLQDQ